jgi:hypothetical protein
VVTSKERGASFGLKVGLVLTRTRGSPVPSDVSGRHSATRGGPVAREASGPDTAGTRPDRARISTASAAIAAALRPKRLPASASPSGLHVPG